MILIIMSFLTFCCKNINWENTKPFVPNIKRAKVIKVYDGDTITIASKIHCMDSNYYRFSVRLANIDCPEIRTINEIEKEYAIKVKNKLEELILNQYIDLNIIKSDKYGRLLAIIYYNNKCINDWLLKNHLAVDYKGKTKVSPENWKEYYDEITFVELEDFNHTCK